MRAILYAIPLILLLLAWHPDGQRLTYQMDGITWGLNQIALDETAPLVLYAARDAQTLPHLDGNPRLFGPQIDLGPYEARYGTLSVTIEGEGNVTVTPEQIRYLFGETVTVTAVAATGWQFDGWQGDLSGTENPATLLVEDDMEITAVFSEEDNDDDPVDPDPVYELYLPLITNS